MQQKIPRKDIKPFDVALDKGQPVQILFKRHWSDGEVCEAWHPTQRNTPKGNFSIYSASRGPFRRP